jgi:Coenzyme PQQ synthesis protein D (PqqD)
MIDPVLERHTAVRQRPGVLFREIDGEAVLLDTEAGIYFGLNEAGTRAWALIGPGARLGAVCDGLLADYDVDEARGWQDLVQLVGDLVRHGLVEISEISESTDGVEPPGAAGAAGSPGSPGSPGSNDDALL